MKLTDNCTDNGIYTILYDNGFSITHNSDDSFFCRKNQNSVLFSSYIERCKSDIIINGQKKSCPKTIKEFINFCKKQGIELEFKEQ